eukprot:5899824-Prymnesium_polylepis.1
MQAAEVHFLFGFSSGPSDALQSTHVFCLSFGEPSNLLPGKNGGVVELAWQSWADSDVLKLAVETFGYIEGGADHYVDQLQGALNVWHGEPEICVTVAEARGEGPAERSCKDTGFFYNDYNCGDSDPRPGCVYSDSFALGEHVDDEGTLVLRNGLCPVCALDHQTELYNLRAGAAKLVLTKRAPLCRCGLRMRMSGFSTFACCRIPEDPWPDDFYDRSPKPEPNDCGYTGVCEISLTRSAVETRRQGDCSRAHVYPFGTSSAHFGTRHVCPVRVPRSAGADEKDSTCVAEATAVHGTEITRRKSRPVDASQLTRLDFLNRPQATHRYDHSSHTAIRGLRNL